MTGAENIFNRAVILRTLVGIFNQQADTGARSAPFKDAGEDFDLVWLATLRGVTRGARTATVKVVL
ncbi:hypothetical protein D3C72_2378890 [compost metagenome]